MVLRMIGKQSVPRAAVNGSVAPVCPIVRSQAPVARASSPVAIVRPTDVPSAIAAINQIITILNPMIQNNYVEYPYVPDWVETNRVVTPVRIFNPNDREQWVDVERISQLTFADRNTDGLWQWDY